MKYVEPEIITIIDPFAADVLDDGGIIPPQSQGGLTSPAAPIILPDGSEAIYDEFGQIIEG